ncbi:MAG: hypothetical protein ABR594_16640 [Pyrinomonadaceae bacterium]
MLDFELPLISGNTTISDAIAEAVDANKSGLLYEVAPGQLRLVHYYGLIQAAKDQGSMPLKDVVFEPVIDIETVPITQIFSHLTNEHRRFGFKGLQAAGLVRVFSISEDFGYPYAVVAPGRRCTRPNKPSHKSPREWYHYPPDNIDSGDPNNCKVCGNPLL